MPQSITIPKIIRHNPREALFVQPLEWTARHLEVLGCSFKEEEYQTLADKHPNGNNHEDDLVDDPPNDFYTKVAEDLAKSETKNTAVIQLLAGSEGPFKLSR